ncbi:hypothetical protein HPP92_018513 [Vanilla planifolia]|uniref:Uncharacterized protein n=1 Tax=Vanilla planifolia TaxID=51239 RepID=A0A835Q8Y1_VANPL|nr:hypothetical protein HPP92_018513 [Vanilla planifolia]
MSELPHYHQMKATVTVPACWRLQSHHPSLGTPRNPNDDKHIPVESRCSHGNSLRSFLLHQAPPASRLRWLPTVYSLPTLDRSGVFFAHRRMERERQSMRCLVLGSPGFPSPGIFFRFPIRFPLP